MDGLQQGAIVTLGIFVAGLIYHAGRMSARLDGVERAVIEAREEVRRELHGIREMLQGALGGRRRLNQDE